MNSITSRVHVVSTNGWPHQSPPQEQEKWTQRTPVIMCSGWPAASSMGASALNTLMMIEWRVSVKTPFVTLCRICDVCHTTCLTQTEGTSWMPPKPQIQIASILATQQISSKRAHKSYNYAHFYLHLLIHYTSPPPGGDPGDRSITKVSGSQAAAVSPPWGTMMTTACTVHCGGLWGQLHILPSCNGPGDIW